MASFPRSPFFPSLIPTTNRTALPFSSTNFLTLKINSSSNPGSAPDSDHNQPEDDPIKLAFAKARAYRNSAQSKPPPPENVRNPIPGTYAAAGNGDDAISGEDTSSEVPLSVKLAFDKAGEYRQGKSGKVDVPNSGLQGGNERDPTLKKPVKNADKEGLSFSSIDFVGLGFSDKKSGRGLPAGLVPISDPFPEGELPEVEILVGDTSKFGTAANAAPVKDDDVDLYKPKVSTWGVFPRPNNISKTYGGGKTIRPGEALESAEERAIKEQRTRQLITAYNSKIGLNIDPKLKSECEKALTEGDILMDSGKLKEALPFYEKVMKILAFQTELHGVAALQWSICQDSLSKRDEARAMYEKLKSHPSPKVSKRARQFFFSFQAMEMMKVSSYSDTPLSTGYQDYFEAFVEKKTDYPLKEGTEDEGALNQALPYVIFLLSPIFMVLLVAASKFQ